MQRIQQIIDKIRLRWRRVSKGNLLRFVVVAILFLIVGISAGTYFALPVQQAPPAVSSEPQEELETVIREQIHTVLADNYPWVLEEPVVPVVVEPPKPELPAPTEPRPDTAQATAAEVDEVSFEHLIWPVKGDIATPFGWYRHPIYQDWRFNAGVEMTAEGEGVRTVLPGKVVSVSSDSVETEVVIDHGGGWSSTYRAVEALAVVPGQEVQQNESIGVPGSQGTIFFGLSHQGEPVNPQAFLR